MSTHSPITSSQGETTLSVILRDLEPIIHEGSYVFCTMPVFDTTIAQLSIGTFREEEGWTVILPQHAADEHGFPYTTLFAWITLTIHSSLEAVGLTSAFSQVLTRANISCNVVAGYYHDHIFVPYDMRLTALATLKALSRCD